ncbi:MAG: putative rane-rane-associated aminoterminal protease [Herbinix sp.]|jgi:membrane protease YdiL (CAAX protease family)|nr:putative rane-rane-associated aminoterminal protease [Herbinix sp.]
MFKNKEGKVRSGWKIAAVTASIFGMILLFTIMISIIPITNLMASGDFDYATMKFNEEGAKVMEGLTLASMFLQEIVFILIPIITWKFILKRPLTNMGLGAFKINVKELFAGLLFGIASITIVFVMIVATGNAYVESFVPRFSSDTVIYLLLFIMVGFAEEIYGRGFVMSTLRQTRNIPVVVIVSSVIFALLHSSNQGISILAYVNLALVGVLFAYMYIKSDNIWMPIGYHITWNYFQGNVFGFKVSGTDTKGIWTTTYESNNILNGGDFGPEGGLIVTIILVLSFLFVKHFYRKRHFDFIATEPTGKPKIPLQDDYSGQNPWQPPSM